VLAVFLPNPGAINYAFKVSKIIICVLLFWVCAVCDELMLGIPRFTWWVGFTAILCLIFAFVFPHFFPLHRLLDYNPQNAKKNKA
jgi:hypothetical protein